MTESDGDEIAAVVAVIVDQARRRRDLVPGEVGVASPRAWLDRGAESSKWRARRS